MFPILAGCCVSCSGFEADDKDDVHRRVERLGGSVSHQLTSLVTHVVVKDSLLSNKYRVAARIGIPAVSAAFLDECEKEARHRSRAPLDAGAPADIGVAVKQATERAWFRPFSGCLVCTTGFDHEARDEMRRLVTATTPREGCTAANVFARHIGGCRPDDFDVMPVLLGGGGTYSGMLTPACTHLVAQSPAGQKYKFAKEWGVRVVTFGWFLDSLRSGYRQEETGYAHGGAASVARKTASAGSLPCSTATSMAGPRGSAPCLARASSGGPEAVYAQPTILLASTLSSRSSAAESAAARLSPHPRSRLQRSMAASGPSPGRLPPLPRYPPNLRNPTDRALPEGAQHGGGSRSLVGKPLRSCSVSDNEPDPFVVARPLLKRGGGATAGQEPPERWGWHKQPRLVSGGLTGTRAAADRDPDGQAADLSSSPPLLELSARSPDPLCARQGGLEAPTESDVGALPNTTCLFAGHLFTSLGFPKSKQAILAQVAEESGGSFVRLSDGLSKALPEPGGAAPRRQILARRELGAFIRAVHSRQASAAYIVVPLAGLDLAGLCCDVVAGSQNVHIVTECWVEQCLQDNMRYPDYCSIESRPDLALGLEPGQHTLFWPLRAGVACDTKPMSLSISGYEGLERDHIGRLAAALGIAFGETFSCRNTHLICRRPFAGKKYERAVKRGIPVVDAAWLYSLAATYAESAGSAADCGRDELATTAMAGTREATTPQVHDQRPGPAAPPRSARHAGVGGDNQPHSTVAAPEPAGVTTPLARAGCQLVADTPGRTPIDVSLERNLYRAVRNRTGSNINQQRRLLSDENYDDEEDDDDVTQLSPTHAPRSSARCAGSADASGCLAPVLGGVVIALSARLSYRRIELAGLAAQLGCRVLARFDADLVTHFVHQANRERERDAQHASRAANGRRIAVVSPWWLHACYDAQARVSEAEYPCTFHPTRRLKLVATSPTSTPQPHTQSRVAGPDDGALALHVTAHRPTSNEDNRPKAPTAAAATDMRSLFGVKAARTQRRYRQKTAATDPVAAAGHSMRSNCTSELPEVPRLEELGDRHRAPSSGAGTPDQGADAAGSSETGSIPARGRWWLNLGPVQSARRSGGGSSQIVSQDLHASSVIDSVPDSAAARNYSCGDASVVDVGTGSAEAPASPVVAHKSRVVYEDVDAQSERERLIQRLVGR